MRSARRRSVMSCMTSTAPAAPGAVTGALRAMITSSGSRGRASSRPSVGVPRSARDLRGDVGLPHDLDVVAALGRPASAASVRAASLTSCSRPCSFTTSTPSIMPERIASMRARSEARSRGAAADLARRIVEHARHGADLVAAVVARRARPVAARVAFGDRARSRGRGGSAASTSPTSGASAATRPTPKRRARCGAPRRAARRHR